MQMLAHEKANHVKMLLKNYRWYALWIQRSEAELSDVEAEIMTVLHGRRAGTGCDVRTNPGDPTRTSTEELERLTTKKVEIENRLNEYRRKRAWAKQAVERLPEMERFIVEERFFRGPASWVEISCFFQTSERMCRKRMDRAIQSLSEMFF